jgi:aminoglycoside phosphotransferase (APT) family kinase protein
VTPEWREWRWIEVTEDRVVLTAPDDAAWRRLQREARVMARFRARAGAVVPRVIAADATARVQTRERGAGASGHDVERMVFGGETLPAARQRYQLDAPLTARGARFADDLGRALARMHAADPDELEVLDRRPLEDRAVEVVDRHVGSLSRAIARAYAWHAALSPDPVASHGDVHLFNLFVDADTGALRTIIDYDDMRIAHRADDLRYLHSCGVPFARAALAAYREESGAAIAEETVARFHAVAALDHFAFVAPDAPRFPRIVEWAVAAVRAFAADWAI